MVNKGIIVAYKRGKGQNKIPRKLHRKIKRAIKKCQK